MNAKFWTYHNDGLIRLTLKPGQSLCWHHFSRHDEGWSCESVKWTHTGTSIIREWCTDGTDCDGRLTHSGSDECQLDELASRLTGGTGCNSQGWFVSARDCHNGQPVSFPNWQEVEPTSVFDQYAQASGY